MNKSVIPTEILTEISQIRASSPVVIYFTQRDIIPVEMINAPEEIFTDKTDLYAMRLSLIESLSNNLLVSAASNATSCPVEKLILLSYPWF